MSQNNCSGLLKPAQPVSGISWTCGVDVAGQTIDVCAAIANAFNYTIINGVINDFFIGDIINPVVDAINDVYCDITGAVDQVEDDLAVFKNLLNGNLISTILVWVSNLIPGVTLEVILYIVIAFLVLLVISMFGGIFAFLGIFI